MELQELDLIFENVKIELTKIDNLQSLSLLQSKTIGKKSLINELFKKIKNLPYDQIKNFSQKINDTKIKLVELFEIKKKELLLLNINKQLFLEKISIELPGEDINFANLHPLSLITEEIINIFQSLGFKTIFGQEVESDEYNFQKLNLPKGHPARDMQDTFYINENLVLRTHCTNMTARLISNLDNSFDQNIAIISAGNVYRRDDDDATHSHQFTQMDGFIIGKNINFCNLKWVLEYFCKSIFANNVKVRMRPSYFPFTEPSVELDISCFKCEQIGCSICKHTGWIEILGAGMISPNVFIACNKDDNLTGFAFGIGIERIAMLKYGLSNIRDFYINNIKFLKLFNKI